MTHNAVGWFEIYVQDIERARNFYETVFQIKLENINMPDAEIWSFPMEMDRVGAGGALVKKAGIPSGGNSTLVYFSSADCAEEESRVIEAGGRIQRTKSAIGEYGFIVLAYDTEGNMIGMHSLQ